MYLSILISIKTIFVTFAVICNNKLILGRFFLPLIFHYLAMICGKAYIFIYIPDSLI